ncbi:hypothetical protein D3C86_1254860 [compost metagenome]
MFWIPWRIAVFCIDRKQMISFRLWIVVFKEIDHFFYSNSIFRNRLPIVYESADIGIRSIININRKSRKRFILWTFKRIFDKRIVIFLGSFSFRLHVHFISFLAFLYFQFSEFFSNFSFGKVFSCPFFSFNYNHAV